MINIGVNCKQQICHCPSKKKKDSFICLGITTAKLEKETFHQLLYYLNGYRSQGWVKLKPGPRIPSESWIPCRGLAGTLAGNRIESGAAGI